MSAPMRAIANAARMWRVLTAHLLDVSYAATGAAKTERR